jgi:hypothetical protein
MTSIDTSALIRGVVRGARSADNPLRIVLLPGETLRIPSPRANVHVLSGTAWLTSGGKDIILCGGQCLSCGEQCQDSAVATEPPVISGLGSQAVLFEVG